MILLLDYPPVTGNKAIRHTKSGGHYRAPKAAAYRTATALQAKAQARAQGLSRPLAVGLRVECEISPPDRRRRDLDNVEKVVFDALTHGGVWEDDFLIADKRTVRASPIKSGRVKITIEEIDELYLSSIGETA